MSATAAQFIGKRMGPHAAPTLRVSADEAARFWSRVQRADGDGCWLWTGSGRNGYGAMNLLLNGRRRPHAAHRISFAIDHGKAPGGRVVMHLCNNKLCVRPNHLLAGTQGENVAAALRDGLITPKEKTCRVCGRDRDQTIATALCHQCYLRTRVSAHRLRRAMDRPLENVRRDTKRLRDHLRVIPPPSLDELCTLIYPRDANVMARWFGLYDQTHENLDSIGTSLNVSRERVRQLVDRAQDHLLAAYSAAATQLHGIAA